MAGRIRREDVEALRERVRIEDVIGEHVTLKSGGVGSLKGLCPFHDEKSPSFHVRPQVGRYHCFGCGEGGDVISFIQKVDGLGFTDAVEYLAGRIGMQVQYEEGGAPRPGEDPGRRQRLVAAHQVAEEFYRSQLVAPEAGAARAFLAERGFDRDAAETFGVGFAPTGWDALMRHLRGRGFTEAELSTSGLVSQGQRGVYDRFRGRLVWPIRDVTGVTVGFGARRLFDEDTGPKYLNTPETPLYRKSQVLYGVDLAKRAIAKEHQVVVVEGYTDVMAMHLSGVGTAVATCGTAFGSDHARVVRRLMGDPGGSSGVQLASGESVGGAIIFTFDGDAAGQKAALKAFGEDQAFSAQTFVAVEASGLDPCELRQQRGPDAVRALVDGRTPLYEFVIRATLAGFDLATAEGRVGALRAAAPVVAGIRDQALRPEYARMLAGWLGTDDLQRVWRAVQSAAGSTAGGSQRDGSRSSSDQRGRGDNGGQGRSGQGGSGQGSPRRDGGQRDGFSQRDGGQRDGFSQRDGGQRGAGFGGADRGQAATVSRAPLPDPRDPVARTERTVLEAILQHPSLLPDDLTDLAADVFAAPAHRAVFEAVLAAGGLQAARQATDPATWVDAVAEEAGDTLRSLVTELSVSPIPEDRPDALPALVRSVVLRMVEIGLTRQIAATRGALQRTDEQSPEYRELFGQLMATEDRRRAIRDAARA